MTDMRPKPSLIRPGAERGAGGGAAVVAGAGARPGAVVGAGGGAVAACAAIGAGCVPPAQVLTPKDLFIRRPGAEALVVVHSRTGATAAVGLTVSELLRTDYIRLVVPRGAGDSYFRTPDRNDTVSIRPARVDLARYRLLFLGSPIWWYYPTAFIYRFIKTHDLSGKRVVLFYTYKGGIRARAVPEWKRLVESRGGRVVGVVAVNRKTLGGESIRAHTARTVAAHKRAWLGPPRPHGGAGPRPSGGGGRPAEAVR